MKCGTPNAVARKACTQTLERALFVKEEKENERILIEYVFEYKFEKYKRENRLCLF